MMYSTVLTSFTCPLEEVYCKERRRQSRKEREKKRKEMEIIGQVKKKERKGREKLEEDK